MKLHHDPIDVTIGENGLRDHPTNSTAPPSHLILYASQKRLAQVGTKPSTIFDGSCDGPL